MRAQHGVDRLQPFLRFYGIEIFKLGGVGHAIESILAMAARAGWRGVVRKLRVLGFAAVAANFRFKKARQ